MPKRGRAAKADLDESEGSDAELDTSHDQGGAAGQEEKSLIPEGVNDLMTLPREVIEQELIRRGYHPGVLTKLPFNYCVFLLRETQGKGQSDQKVTKNFTTWRSSRMKKQKVPIFGGPDAQPTAE
jgi:hypothetical protein